MSWCDRCNGLGILTLFEGDLFVAEADCPCGDDMCGCPSCETRREEEDWEDD